MARRSRLKRKSGAKKQRLPKKQFWMKQFIDDVRLVSRAMGKTKTFAVYIIPNIMISKRPFGGKKKFLDSMKRVYPEIPYKVEFINKGKLSTDVKLSNITANQAIEIMSFFLISGGTLKMEQTGKPERPLFGKRKK